MLKLNLKSFFSLLSIQVHLNIARLTITDNKRECYYKNITFQECDVMFCTNWTLCDGETCPIGQQTRDKGICCIQDNIGSKYTLNEMCCKRCNFTSEDFRETVSRNVSSEFSSEASDTNSQETIRTCNHANRIFKECDVMFYTNWTICDGKSCPTGQQTRSKGICCIQENGETGQTLKNRCMQNCNFTDEDFQETIPRNVTSTEIENKTSEINLKGLSIAGAVIGVLAISGLIGLLIFFLCRRWKKQKKVRKVEAKENEERNN